YTIVVTGAPADNTRYCTISNSTLVVIGNEASSSEFELCSQIASSTPNAGQALGACVQCANQNGVWTAIGCVQTDAQSIIRSLMRLGLGIAGGVALIMILAAGFLFSTSQGDVKRTAEAKDMMSSAVIGL